MKLPHEAASVADIGAQRLGRPAVGEQASYDSADRFIVVINVSGITDDDAQYFRYRPEQTERFRPVLPEELEIEPTTTDVYVFEARYFDGGRTGLRHRVFLRRVERQP